MRKSPQQQWMEMHEHINRRVAELTRGYPPEFNVAPLRECLISAYLLGYDLVPLASAPQSAAEGER